MTPLTLQDLRSRFGEDWETMGRMSIIEETSSGEKCASPIDQIFWKISWY